MARWTIAALLLVFAAEASAAFIVRIGDVVYVDGTKYDWTEWKKIRDTYQPASMAPAASGQEPLAATCVTGIYYDEFPSDDERFHCSAGLGSLTRDEILRRGWKVDLIEKIPPPSGSPSQSPRGRPVSLYKLVISRSGAPAPRIEPIVPAGASTARRTTDMLCMQDCEGNGATRTFCEDRCSN